MNHVTATHCGFKVMASGSGNGDGGPNPRINPLIPSPPPYTGIFGAETADQRSAQVLAHLEPLRHVNVPIDLYTPEAINRAGLTTDGFLKMSRVVTTFTDPAVYNRVLVMGIQARVVNEVTNMPLNEFISLCKWLRTSAGQKAMQEAVEWGKASKKALPGVSVVRATLSHVLSIQLQDLRTNEKKIRKKFDRKIHDLRMKIRKTERQRDDALLILEQEQPSLDNEGIKIRATDPGFECQWGSSLSDK